MNLVILAAIALILLVLGLLGASSLFLLFMLGLLLFIGGCIVIALRTRITATGPGMFWAGFFILVVCAVVSSAQVVFARDPTGQYANSPLKPWFDSLRSGKGPCCSDADGTALSDIDWKTTPDGKHYSVRIEDKWWDVPDEAVITEPNRAGRTMVWPIYNRAIGGAVNIEIRCFLPGSMT